MTKIILVLNLFSQKGPYSVISFVPQEHFSQPLLRESRFTSDRGENEILAESPSPLFSHGLIFINQSQKSQLHTSLAMVSALKILLSFFPNDDN